MKIITQWFKYIIVLQSQKRPRGYSTDMKRFKENIYFKIVEQPSLLKMYVLTYVYEFCSRPNFLHGASRHICLHE